MVTISGFSDEISDDFEEQLRTVTRLGTRHISIRGVNGANFSDLSEDEVARDVLPLLKDYGVSVSSIGSPIGKIFIDDEDGFADQLQMMERICRHAQRLQCRFIRVFSFFMPDGDDPDLHRDQVLTKMKAFCDIAAPHGVMLLHENEKDIFGDTAARCLTLLRGLKTPRFRAIFDFANFVQVGQDPVAAYEMLESYVDYIHIKDARFDHSANVVAGAGDGQIEALLGRFLANGYDGFLTLEPHLAMFGMLQGLEQEDVEKIVGDLSITGAEGYAMQLEALCAMLKRAGVTPC